MNLHILFGQTATGKTAKALELCKKYNGEIVNFDSRQVYRKLDIVTGKDSPQDTKFKIWLYDIVDPKEPFSSAEYVRCAERVIGDIISRGKTPILVGGTGHYLRHLIFGAPEITVQEDSKLRASLNSKSVSKLQTILADKNKAFLDELNNSDRNNPHRLIRRIEIAQAGLVTLPAQNTRETLSSRLAQPLTISYIPFFHYSRIVLLERITARVEARLKQGALEEVKNLLKEGYTATDPGLNAIGYQELIAYLQGNISIDEAKKQWATHEIQYAKRQKTYFLKYFPTK